MYSTIKAREFEEEDMREIPRLLEGMERPIRKHRFKITEGDVEECGPTEDCNGCYRAMIGDSQRPHNESCRDRFAENLMRDGDTRVDRDIERLIEQQEFARETVGATPI